MFVEEDGARVGRGGDGDALSGAGDFGIGASVGDGEKRLLDTESTYLYIYLP